MSCIQWFFFCYPSPHFQILLIFPKLNADVCPSSNPDALPLVLLVQRHVTSSVPEQGYLYLTSNNETIRAAMDREQTLCLALFTAYFKS